MLIEELQPVEREQINQLQKSNTFMSRQPNRLEYNKGGSFSARDVQSSAFMQDMKTNVESQ